MTSGSVTMEGVSLLCGDVMEMEIVWMVQMKWTALVGTILHITVSSIFVFL